MNARTPLVAATPLHAARWDAQAQPLVCVEVVAELDDVTSYGFEAVGGAHFHYLPGQHLTLELMVDGAAEYRVFTLSSTPTRPDRLWISVKTTRPEGVTAWMQTNLRVGMQVRARGPSGNFSLVKHPSRRILFLSGGSGITPMLSMLRWLHDRRETREIVFVHAAMSPSRALFADELQAMDRAMPNLRLVQLVTQVPAGETWSGYTGHFDGRQLDSFCGSLDDFTVFCCGPGPFMKRARDVLAARGFDMARYHEEVFTPAGLPVAVTADAAVAGPLSPASEGVPGADGFAVRIDGKQIVVRATELLYDAMRRQGVSIATGCKSGLCGTCRLTLDEGEVAMTHQGGISAREERDGVILACCSRPRSDLALRRMPF